MEALRKGLRFGRGGGVEEPGVDSEGNQQSRPETIRRLPSATPSLVAPLQASLAIQPETTVKNKLISAWNTVKYGKNGFTQAADMFGQGFSKNSPVWLLGQAYHRKLVVGPGDEGEYGGSPVGDTVSTFTEIDCGIEAFEKDYHSKVWMSYRKDFEEIPGTVMSSDCGWGCMLRSGQMLVAQALVLHWLGRGWRRNTATTVSSLDSWREDRLHRTILQLFGDSPDSSVSPLSIHCLVGLSTGLGRKAGDWYGPATTAHLMAGALRQSQRSTVGRGLLEGLAVYVANGAAVYKGDVVVLCEGDKVDNRQQEKHDGEEEEDFSILEVPGQGRDTAMYSLGQEVDIDGETWCLEQEARHWKTPELDNSPVPDWKALVLLVPMRLGTEVLNPLYAPCIKALFTIDSCIGIIGGKPKHSLYFVGFQDEHLIHLDPHRLQDTVDTLRHNFPTDSYHSRQPRKLKLSRMDPSCCVGFYLRTREDFESWCSSIDSIVTPYQIDGIRIEYPLFSVLEGRSDYSGEPGSDWVRLAQQGVEPSCEPGHLVQEEEEAEDFEFL